MLSLTILTGGQYGLALLPVSLPVALRARLDHEVSLSEAVKTAGWAPGTTCICTRVCVCVYVVVLCARAFVVLAVCVCLCVLGVCVCACAYACVCMCVGLHVWG